MNKPGFIICFLAISFLPFKIFSQDVNALLQEAKQLEAAFKDREALAKYQEVLGLQPNHLAALCKVSEWYNILGNRQSTKDKQKEYYRSAKTYAQKALQVNAGSADANVVMAIAMGRMALISSGNEKISAVKDIKSYAEKAIQLDANNFKAYHVLGKWHYEVSDLSAIEKWLVKIAYQELPKASLEDAIRHFEKSRTLNTGFLLNYLELARCWHRKDNDQKAVELLEAMLQLPNSFTDDASTKEEGRKLLKKWKE